MEVLILNNQRAQYCQLIQLMDRDYEVKKINKIYVSNLNYSTTEDDLRQLFEKSGSIRDITIKQKQSITFAFVEFDSVAEAEAAINEYESLRCNGKQLIGNEIKVSFAKGGNDRRGGFQERGRGRFEGDRGGYGNRNYDGPPRRDFGDRPRGCFNCGEQGHMIKDCPKPKKPREFNREGGYQRRPYENRGEGDRGSRGGDRGGYQNKSRDFGERGSYEKKERGGYGGRGGDREGYKGRRKDSSSSRSRGSRDKKQHRQRSASSSR